MYITQYNIILARANARRTLYYNVIVCGHRMTSMVRIRERVRSTDAAEDDEITGTQNDNRIIKHVASHHPHAEPFGINQDELIINIYIYIRFIFFINSRRRKKHESYAGRIF